MKPSYEQLRSLAAEHGQEHLFRFWDRLDKARQSELRNDLARIDFSTVSRLIERGLDGEHGAIDWSKVEAPEVYPAEPGPNLQEEYEEAVRQGVALLSGNKVAAMVVAGGQGTRLGFDGPKGTFPISPVKSKTLFQLFAEAIRATCRRYNCRLPWYVMTSDVNDGPTRRFFEEHDYFGLDREDVQFFQQGVMPAVDRQGRILLADRHQVALSPNGHGGSLTALRDSGVLAEMGRRGIEAISYFQVDNPLVSPADPLFLGLHRVTGSQMSSIAVPKADDLERVGHFVKMDGKLRIIEYSDLPEELARARNPDGSRVLNAGSVAIHVLDRGFVENITGGGHLELPWHLAHKKVPYLDLETERQVDPAEPNAVKFEMFIFDAIPLAEGAIVIEQPRDEWFSPVKNAEGVDSPQTARRDMVLRAMKWLEACGVSCPRTEAGLPAATVEISPLMALDAKELRQRLTGPVQIRPADEVYLEP